MRTSVRLWLYRWDVRQLERGADATASGVLCVRVRTSGEAEVANCKVAVSVDEQVRWFEVPVEHVCAVDVLEAPEYLVQEILEVLVRQGLVAVGGVVCMRACARACVVLCCVVKVQ